MEKAEVFRLSDEGDKQDGGEPDEKLRQSPFEETKFRLGHKGFTLTIKRVSTEQKKKQQTT